MNTQQAIPTILRPPSGPTGIFLIWPGWNIIEHLTIAEAWSKKNGVGASVYLMPGVHEWRECFYFFHIGSIRGFGIKSTRVRRYGNGLLKSVWDFPMQDHSPEISGFEIENMVATSEPAIELGGQQNAVVGEISSVGKSADLIYVTNATPTDNPPAGRPWGCWTENLTLRFPVVIYGPKTAGIRLRVTDGQKRGQSFSRFHGAAQITLVDPGSIGVDFESHCHVYSGEMRFKFNGDDASLGQAICMNVGPECNITDNFYDSFVEGRGIRIRVAPSARVTGHGQFTRQLAEHSRDEITPGQNWKGLPAGYVEWGILRDQIKI